MGLFRKAFMSAAGIHDEAAHSSTEPKKGSYEWKKEHLTAEQMKFTKDNRERYSPIPAIPTDIGYGGGKITGKKQSGVFSQVSHNPAVIVGMGLTTLALLGMFRSSFMGDKLGTQKYMQYRIMAQFFTVTALVAGVTIFGGTFSKEDEEKPKQ